MAITATELALKLGWIALKFGEVNRATFHADGMTPETDTTHTVMLGWIACSLAPEGLNRGLIAQFALVHDLPEVYAGDTNSLNMTVDEETSKNERERAALIRLESEFGTMSWIVSHLHAYERQRLPEARWVRYIDKAMPKITHTFNDCQSVRDMGLSRDALVRAHDLQLAKLHRKYPELEDYGGPIMRELMNKAVDSYRDYMSL